MKIGIHSRVTGLYDHLLLRWVPKWYGAFCAPDGGFYERLDGAFQPIQGHPRRLVTHCRLLALLSDASSRYKEKQLIPACSPDLKMHFRFILDRFGSEYPAGFWAFSLDDAGQVHDKTCDLYALAFVMFACAHYGRATQDPEAERVARSVLTLVDTKFRLPQGFAEALDGETGAVRTPNGIRRQNPHMHLLEACLFAYETWKDLAYLSMADEIILLFYNVFYDRAAQVVREFFDAEFRPHPERGSCVEPGHSFEWVWLLEKHACAKNDPKMHQNASIMLLERANHYGWDPLYGGIFDSLTLEGSVVADTKRLWPFCEALKANALMLSVSPHRQGIKDRVAAMVFVFLNHYMDGRGFWTEWLTRNLTSVTDYMPGTTPYHVYFGITETMDILDRRGPHKSIFTNIAQSLRRARTLASRGVRGVKRGLRQGGFSVIEKP